MSSEVLNFEAFGSRNTTYKGPPIYESSGELFVPSEMAIGPWFPDVQHGGAVAGLLARALEKLPAATEMRITSMNVELFRKVPLRPVRVVAKIVRDGRRIGALTASLFDESKEQELARAQATRIRETTEVVTPKQVPDPFPEDQKPDYEGPFYELELPNERFNYPRAFEAYRDAREQLGRGCSWWRLKHSFVDDEIPSPLVRTAATADLIMSANSILGFKVPYISINPDLYISLQRVVEGDWICLESNVRIDALGTGETDAVLYDGRGRFGLAIKSLLIDRP